MRRLVAAWQPRLLVFVKFDCWPNQVLAARRRRRARRPAGRLAAAAVARACSPWRAAFFRDLFDRFAHLGVSTEEDRRRFVDDLGVHCPVSVTGDTRADQVIRRWEAAQGGATSPRACARLGGRLLVLGSTWPPDEKLWLPVLADLLAAHPDLRVVLTPARAVCRRGWRPWSAQLAAAGVTRRLRLSALMRGRRAGRRGPSAACWSIRSACWRRSTAPGHLAYVGGSFTTGVHNTLEPAVGRPAGAVRPGDPERRGSRRAGAARRRPGRAPPDRGAGRAPPRCSTTPAPWPRRRRRPRGRPRAARAPPPGAWPCWPPLCSSRGIR